MISSPAARTEGTGGARERMSDTTRRTEVKQTALTSAARVARARLPTSHA
jgi:hypothetical protein